MNVLCKNCGRRFDPELTNGACPYCGRYSTEKPEPEQPEPEKAQPRVVVVEKNTGSANRGGWILVKVLAALLVVTLIAFPLTIQGKKRQKAQQPGVEKAQEEMVEPGQMMIVGPQKREAIPGEAQILTGIRGLEEDAQLARVFFKVNRQKEWASSLQTNCFMQVDEVYYPAMSKYDLERSYPELAEKALEEYAFTGVNMDEGWLYFVVPKGTREAVAWVQEQKRDKDFEVRSVKMIGVPVHLEEEAFTE